MPQVNDDAARSAAESWAEANCQPGGMTIVPLWNEFELSEALVPSKVAKSPPFRCTTASGPANAEEAAPGHDPARNESDAHVDVQD